MEQIKHSVSHISTDFSHAHPRPLKDHICSGVYLYCPLHRGSPTVQGEEAGVDVQGSTPGNLQKAFGENISIRASDAQVRAKAFKPLQELLLKHSTSKCMRVHAFLVRGLGVYLDTLMNNFCPRFHIFACSEKRTR
jgi:hypothetical protein